MVKLEGDPSEIRRQSLRGAFYITTWRGKLVMKSWPKKRSGQLSAKQAAAVEKFKQAAIATKHMDYGDQNQSRVLTKGTNALPRDLLMMALYGRLGTFYLMDGTRIYSVATLQDLTELLDILSQSPGALIYRGDQYWEGLEPGNTDDVLAMQSSGKPGWSASAGGGGLVPTQIAGGGTSASASASKGFYFTPLVDMKIHGAFPNYVAVSGASYRCVLASATALVIDEVLATSDTLDDPGAGSRVDYFDFGGAIEVAAGQQVVCLHTRTDASDTTSSGLRASTSGNPPGPVAYDWGYCRYSHITLANGQSEADAATGNPYAMNFLYSL